MNPEPQPNITTRQHVIRTCEQMYREVLAAKAEGKSVGVVMTMGALHAGHLSLAKASCKACDYTVVTIFVNPTQFGAEEDLDQYPRELQRDLERLSELNVDSVFAPSSTEMYADGLATTINPHPIARKLEGLCRPGHFSGVATIVLKLLNVIPADKAFFGSKDYQQYLVIKKLVEDLNVPVDIIACPIVRELDGLAMSSRNRYLSDTQREQAIAISQSLKLAADLASEGEMAGRIATRIRRRLAEAGIRRIDYVAIVDPDTLIDLKQIDTPALVAIAAYVGQTRLIDNRIIRPLE